MTYTEKFHMADDYIAHLDAVMGGIRDPFIQSRYLGFVVISAVTVYELAIKDIFFEFSEKKHKVLGNFSRAHFDRINGRIRIRNLTEEHVKKFGEKYSDKFKKLLEEEEIRTLKIAKTSIKSSYGNVIQWRNDFVHQGLAPTTTNYEEIKAAYNAGKEVLRCLDRAMTR